MTTPTVPALPIPSVSSPNDDSPSFRGRGRGGRGTPFRVRGRGGRSAVITPAEPRLSTTIDQSTENSTPPTKVKHRFPLLSIDHGHTLVRVNVGEGEYATPFSIHKNLLCAASDYFSAALGGNFKEGQSQMLDLKQFDSNAFEVLYQYIYTGIVKDARFYVKSVTPADVLWLRTFKLADATMVSELKVIAYDRLRERFSNELTGFAPSQTFIDELFNYEYPQDALQYYLIRHSAFWILKGRHEFSWRYWALLMQNNTAFGASVAIELTKNLALGERQHPHDDLDFEPEELFPTKEQAEEKKKKNFLEPILGVDELKKLMAT